MKMHNDMPEIIDLTDYDVLIESVEVVSATYLTECKLHIFFSDNTEQTVDFQPFLETTPDRSLKKYLHPEHLQGFKIFNGNLNWNQYDMIFPVDDLHRNLL
jgi:Protein of unknown function (DUF2442)